MFDTHNWIDHQLLTILGEIKKNEANMKGPLVNTIVVDKKVVKIYNMLVTETPKIINIPQLKESFDKLGSVLKDKISVALTNSEKKETDSNVPINMGGVGIA